ncbi:hypothetical protein TNCT6_04710 [Streptomyces sp. 6-11-2]|nr:hypothetical protein TNCT6_04710 [Streptomyces sp. 6-11-2]
MHAVATARTVRRTRVERVEYVRTRTPLLMEGPDGDCPSGTRGEWHAARHRRNDRAWRKHDNAEFRQGPPPDGVGSPG